MSEEPFGPPLRGKARRPVGRLALQIALVGLLVLVLAAVGVGAALLAYTSSELEREQVAGLQPPRGGPRNVLVVGSDSRGGLSPEELQALGTHDVDSGRTDTILLLSVQGSDAALLSLPRDLFVTRCDGSQGRINAAIGIGGASCLVETVTRLTGLPVHHYVEVSFVGFWRVVDAVGGVTVYLDAPLHDPPAGADLAAGCQRLDGREALGFVRARSVDSDLGRVARQQRFAIQLAKEIVRPGTLLHVPRLFSVAGASARAVTADEELGPIDLARIGWGLRALRRSELAMHTVPTVPENIGGAAVLVPIAEEAEALFARFRDGSALQPAPEEPAPEPQAGGDATPAEEPAEGAGGEPDAAEGSGESAQPAAPAWDGPLGAGPVPPSCAEALAEP